MTTQILYLSQIRTVMPKVEFSRVEQAGGQYNDVVIVNREWIFRFPRYREAVNMLAAETRLLESLRGRLPLPIPDPIYQKFDPPVPGLAFTGYRSLPGEPFLREALEAVRDEWVREDLASQLARFLRSLHAIPPQEVNLAQLRAADGRAEWEAMYAEIRSKLYPAMRPDARKQVTEHFEAYLDDLRLHGFTPCLRHGDFGGPNILWDPRKGAVTGVIDFSFCALGDPAADLASISTQGEDFFARLAPRYEPDDAKRAALLARARFYRGTFALSEALDGLRLSDPEAYRRGMEEYV